MSKKHRTFLRDDALVVTYCNGAQVAIGRDPENDAKLRTVADLNQEDFAQVNSGIQMIAKRMGQFASNNIQIREATKDAELYGNGYLRVNKDGSLERIDPLRVNMTMVPEGWTK